MELKLLWLSGTDIGHPWFNLIKMITVGLQLSYTTYSLLDPHQALIGTLSVIDSLSVNSIYRLENIVQIAAALILFWIC